MNLDEIMLLKYDVFIKDLKYVVNDKFFFYNVLTKGGDELVYKYNKKQHEQIEYEKECLYWQDFGN